MTGDVYVAWGRDETSDVERYYVVVWDAEDGPRNEETLWPSLRAAERAARELAAELHLDHVLCDEQGPIP